MLVIALLLATAGSALLVGSVLTFRQKRIDRDVAELEWRTPLCEAPSPDDSMMCDSEFGHWGWHGNSGTPWFGDAWGVSQWDNTQEAPVVEQEPTMSATQWEREKERPQRQVKRPKYRKPAGQPEEMLPLSRAEKRRIRAEKRRIKRGKNAIAGLARTNPTPEQMAAVRANLHRMGEHRRQRTQQAEIQKTIDIENFQKKKAEMREKINGTEPVRFNPFGNLKTIGPHPLKFTVGAMGTRRPAGEHKPINVTVAKDHPVTATKDRPVTVAKDRPVTVAKGHTKWLI